MKSLQLKKKQKNVNKEKYKAFFRKTYHKNHQFMIIPLDVKTLLNDDLMFLTLIYDQPMI